MSKKEPLPILHTVSPEVPVTFCVSPALNGKKEALNTVDTDLLVLTKLQHTIFGGGPAAVDDKLGGLISQKLSQAHLQGQCGQHILFSTGDSRIRNVLIVGIGNAAQVGRPTVCGLFELILEKADEIGARKVSLPIFSGRLTDLNLRGTLAILRCRTAQHYSRGSHQSRLEEFEILCSPQAKRHINEGLMVQDPLCDHCPDPRLERATS